MNMIIIKKDNLYGMIDENGEMIIKAEYQDMRNFSNGFAAVCKDDRWGYIDEDGRLAISCIYSQAEDFSVHGRAAVKLDENSLSWILIDADGEAVGIEDKNRYYFIDKFNDQGFARVGTPSGYRIIDREGSYTDDKSYNSLKYDPVQNIFIGEELGRFCLINIEGNVLVQTQEDYDELYYPSNGLCQVSKDGKCGYIDQGGSLVIPLRYEEAYEFSDNGLAFVVCENGLGGYINKEDKFLIEPTLESGSTFSFGMAAVSKGGKYIFIYENGKKAIDYVFEYASGFSECGLAKVELADGRQELIRPDGSAVITLKKGCEIEEFIGESQVTKFRVHGKEALINSKGEIISDLIYDEIIITSGSGLHPFLRDGLWGYIDDEGYEVIDNIYLSASQFNDWNTALAEIYDEREDMVRGLYIDDRNEIIDYRLVRMFEQSFADKYSKVYEFTGGIALAVRRERTAVMNACGKEILPAEFNLTVKNDQLMVELRQEKH